MRRSTALHRPRIEWLRVRVNPCRVMSNTSFHLMICHPERSEGPALLCSATTFTSWPVSRGSLHRDHERHLAASLGAQERYDSGIHKQVSCPFALYTLKASSTSGTPWREKNLSSVGCGRGKVALIRSTNPTWEDLSESWFDEKTVMHTKLDAKMTEKQVLRSAQDDKH